jgi:hypothetical protein
VREIGALEGVGGLAVEEHGAGGRALQQQEQAGQRGLARPGLADDAERLALADPHADPVERLDDTLRPTERQPSPRREVLLQPDALEHHRAWLPAGSAVQQCATWPSSRGTAGGYSASHCG